MGICGSEASLVYMVRPCLQTNKSKVLNVMRAVGRLRQDCPPGPWRPSWATIRLSKEKQQGICADGDSSTSTILPSGTETGGLSLQALLLQKACDAGFWRSVALSG